MEAAGDKLFKELRELVAAAEELLAEAGSENPARERLEGAGAELEERVRRHPLAALGIAAGVGLLIGVLLSRK